MGNPEAEILRPLISIIVPCLNERKVIDTTLACLLRTAPDTEIIVVDGGSTDGTLARLAHPRIQVLQTRKGRGHQLDFGARHARGSMLWFLHADTLITPEAEGALRKIATEGLVQSGNFQIIFDGPTTGARCMTGIYGWLRWLGLCYGDSGYFVRAETYRAVGGFQDFPIFEDLDLLRRLRRVGPFVRLPANVITSSRRMEQRTFPVMFAYWTFLQVLYWIGWDPRRLERLYREVR
jgi:rSAM/selenodomain-associated transferase 2